MARSTSPPRKALWAITATVAVVALAAGPASARTQRPFPLAGRHAVTAQCQASDLRISVPAAIKGDPARGMGKQDWNLLFLNTSSTACSLRSPCGFTSTSCGRAAGGMRDRAP